MPPGTSIKEKQGSPNDPRASFKVAETGGLPQSFGQQLVGFVGVH
ncbi:hypothetical protein WKV53_27770 [Luteolibacter sp. Y139]|uniref:Uncharacterized protein n=1 Tax=Luteolibacter soli TaxID=3135280 RepID=A0ABU9B507_9BACT